MTGISNRLTICLILAACLFLKGLAFPVLSLASNEAARLNATESQGKIKAAIFLSGRPEYTVGSLDEKHILLTFKDTLKGSGFVKNVQAGALISINEDKNPDCLKVTFGLSKSCGKVDCFWSENKKLFYIEISPQESQPDNSSSEGAASLQDIKFGFTGKATRMVMRLNYYPAWGMELPGQSRLLLRLLNVTDGLKQKKFGTVKRLKEINVRKSGGRDTEISLGAESTLNHVAFFRGEERLVLDIMDEPASIPDEVLGTATGAQSPAVSLINHQASVNETSNSGHAVRMRIAEDNPAVNMPAQTVQATPAPSTPVKASEPSNPAVKEPETQVPSQPAASEKPASANDAKADAPVKIEPKFDNTLPMSSKLKKSIDGLKPGEAFLFGRIQQAMDIKDYEKGLALVDQFLKESPGSSMTEALMFLKGDFYYCLWKSGNSEALENISSTYQSAIDRFSESDSAPLSYIKMAQADSTRKGGEYMALGYLGLVLTQKKEKDLLPLAYLTRGKIFLKLNLTEKALADFKAILEQYKRSDYAAEANFWIANYYHSAGLYEEAQKRLDEVQDQNPYIYIDHPEYLFLRAKNCLYMKNYDCAREYLFKAANIGRQQEGADMLLTRIGDTYHTQENEKEAGKYYRMVIDYYPGTEGASISKLRLASSTSDMAALDELGSGKEGESIGELAILQKGYQMYDKKEYGSVIDGMKQLIDKPMQTETRKSARSLYFNAADKEMIRLYQLGKYKELTDLYESIQTPTSENISSEAILTAAQAYNRSSLPEKAITLFQKIIPDELNPELKSSYYTGLADAYLGTGNKSSSRSLLEKARDNESDQAGKRRINRSLAKLYMEENMLDEAYSLCKTLMAAEKGLSNDDAVETYILAGKILNKQQKYDDAVKTLNSIPGMPDRISSSVLKSVYMELGNAYYSAGDYPKAAKSYEGGFNLGYGPENKDYWDARFNLAEAYFNAGAEKKARTLLTEISESGDTLMQQRAALKLGSMDLEKQLQRLSIGKNQQ
jgi:tetratricopeptide (TPR) repeat protein